MRKLQEITGFTLIEILIVIILLGILAAIIVPQVSISSSDTKLTTLKNDLKIIRNAIQLYHHQHNNTYPGKKKTNGIQDTENPNQAAVAFVAQLTLYTDETGQTRPEKDATHILGPYIKKGILPHNPINNKNDLKCDITTTDITDRTSDGGTGWKFYTETGVFMANDGGHDND